MSQGTAVLASLHPASVALCSLKCTPFVHLFPSYLPPILYSAHCLLLSNPGSTGHIKPRPFCLASKPWWPFLPSPTPPLLRFLPTYSPGLLIQSSHRMPSAPPPCPSLTFFSFKPCPQTHLFQKRIQGALPDPGHLAATHSPRALCLRARALR